MMRLRLFSHGCSSVETAIIFNMVMHVGEARVVKIGSIRIFN